MKKFGYITMVGVFCLLMGGCLSLFSIKEIPEARRADIADIPTLIVGTWKVDKWTTNVFDENGKFVNIAVDNAYELTYNISGNILTRGEDNRRIIYIDKNGKEMSTRIVGTNLVGKMIKINGNHDLTVYAEQIKKTQELAKAANEKAEVEALERKVAAGYTEAGIIRSRTIIAEHKHLNSTYEIFINFSIKKINGKDPVRQIGNNYWVPAGRSEITYGITSKMGDSVDVEIRGITGWLESSTEGTREHYFADGESYDLIFEMNDQQVFDLILKNTVATPDISIQGNQMIRTLRIGYEYDVRIEPR